MINMIFFLNKNLDLMCFIMLIINTLLVWGKALLKQNRILTHICHFNTIICIVTYTIIMIQRWILIGHVPLSNLYESSMFLVWNLILLHFVIQQTNSQNWGSIILTPISALIQGFTTFGIPLSMQKLNQFTPALHSNWLLMHVSMMIISYSLLLLGCMLSISYITIIVELQQFSIKETYNESSLTLRPVAILSDSTWLKSNLIFARQICLLHELDYWSYKCLGSGFTFLTIGILSGAVWANEAWGAYWSWDPKETWAMITWIIFAIYLHARMIKRWNGEKTAFLALVGFFVLWMCYLGVNLLGQGLHSYGWVG